MSEETDAMVKEMILMIEAVALEKIEQRDKRISELEAELKKHKELAEQFAFDAKVGADENKRLQVKVKELGGATSQACMVQGLLGFDASTMPEQVIARVDALITAEARVKELKEFLYSARKDRDEETARRGELQAKVKELEGEVEKANLRVSIYSDGYSFEQDKHDKCKDRIRELEARHIEMQVEYSRARGNEAVLQQKVKELEDELQNVRNQLGNQILQNEVNASRDPKIRGV